MAQASPKRPSRKGDRLNLAGSRTPSSLVEQGSRALWDSDLAMLCISALEGAITLSRVKRSTHPIDTVRTRIVPMLVTTA
jgi:hypothetical protein